MKFTWGGLLCRFNSLQLHTYFSHGSYGSRGGAWGYSRYSQIPVFSSDEKKTFFASEINFKTFLSIDFKSNIHLNSIHLNNFWASFQRQRNIYSVIHSNDVMIAVVKKFWHPICHRGQPIRENSEYIGFVFSKRNDVDNNRPLLYQIIILKGALASTYSDWIWIPWPKRGLSRREFCSGQYLFSK